PLNHDPFERQSMVNHYQLAIFGRLPKQWFFNEIINEGGKRFDFFHTFKNPPSSRKTCLIYIQRTVRSSTKCGVRRPDSNTYKASTEQGEVDQRITRTHHPVSWHTQASHQFLQ